MTINGQYTIRKQYYTIKLKAHSCLCVHACSSCMHEWSRWWWWSCLQFCTLWWNVVRWIQVLLTLNEYSSWLFWAREIFHTYTHTHTPPHTPPPTHTHTHNKRFSYLNNNCISWFIGFLHLGIGMITHTWFWIHDIMIHCRPPWFFLKILKIYEKGEQNKM